MLELYTTTTCTKCVSIKKLLEDRSISYKEMVIDKDDEAMKKATEYGFASVPVLVNLGDIIKYENIRTYVNTYI